MGSLWQRQELNPGPQGPVQCFVRTVILLLLLALNEPSWRGPRRPCNAICGVRVRGAVLLAYLGSEQIGMSLGGETPLSTGAHGVWSESRGAHTPARRHFWELSEKEERTRGYPELLLIPLTLVSRYVDVGRWLRWGFSKVAQTTRIWPQAQSWKGSGAGEAILSSPYTVVLPPDTLLHRGDLSFGGSAAMPRCRFVQGLQSPVDPSFPRAAPRLHRTRDSSSQQHSGAGCVQMPQALCLACHGFLKHKV